ncbi:MAG TPA: argininosuccinate lyase [Phycisphaerae bacterium]
MRAKNTQRLWDKGGDVDAVIHRFTVGDDPHWDRYLVHWDCIASAAHARTLAKAGVLSEVELETLTGGLAQIDTLDREGQFEIPEELEDCHTAIEAWLTKHVGEAGAKIHTARSRNDQVAVAMRLYMRHHVLEWVSALERFINTCQERMERDGDIPMPGYTHMQPAMPSSVGMWLHAFAEAALEQMRACSDLLERLDCCPLGTGAGFGVALPLNREYTAKLLGFSRVQRSPIDVQNSRGRMETYFVRVAVDIGAFLEKLAWDLILFSTAEYGFFSLPESMTTGSSIMPQKRNPDVLELLRARAGRLRGRLHELEWVAGKLPSNYHRDLQLTKEPTIRAALDIEDMLLVAERVVAGFTLHHDKLEAAMRPELYAADAAYTLVQQGVPFRRAYREIAEQLRRGIQPLRPTTSVWSSTRASVLKEVRSELQLFAAERAKLRSATRRIESLLDVASPSLAGCENRAPAPKGRAKPAQGNALGSERTARDEALKGRAKSHPSQ